MFEPAIPATSSRPWFRIALRILFIFATLLVSAGFIYENISEARDRRFQPVPGHLVDVGGYKIHIYCVGQGSPTVILDSGLGDSYASWHKVQPQIAQFTRVCSYDRAGLGYSDSSPHPRTSQVMAEELHTLLNKTGLAPPYILVGHSMAGYDVRLYAARYPGEVSGMVLVDASHPEQLKRFPPALNDMDAGWLREAEFMEFTMPFGIPRLMGFCGSDPIRRAAECNFHSAREGVAELKTVAESAAQAATAGSLGDMPLAVLSHDPDLPEPDLPADLVKPTNDAWSRMQEELAHLSTRSSHTVAKNSSHYIQIDRPDLVIDGVRQVVEQARKAQPQ